MCKVLMKIGIAVFALLAVAFVVLATIGLQGCDWWEDPEDPEPGGDTDTDADSDTDTDTDADSDTIYYDEITVCSVGIQFAYYGDGEVFQVTLTNYNAVTVMVVMENETNPGTPAHNCLWPAGYVGTGEGSDEDVNDVSFDRDDELVIDVRTLADLDLGLTCDLAFTYYWDSYAVECESLVY